MNIENEVLITLLNAGGGSLTVTIIHRRVAARHPDEAPSWREVANTVSRLSTRGWVAIADEEAIGEDVHPMFALTAAGDMAARQIRARAQLESAKEGRK